MDTGASNHYSPFKCLFLSLIPCDIPVEVLTGNGWVYAYYYGTIPLIIKVNNTLMHVHLENVLYVPTLQTRVNLFSVIVVADRGYNIDFSRSEVRFRQGGETLATGTRIGNSWWLDCDIRSHAICLAIRDDDGKRISQRPCRHGINEGDHHRASRQKPPEFAIYTILLNVG